MAYQPVRNLVWLIQMCSQFPRRIPNISALNKLNQLTNAWVLFRHENDPINSSQIFNWFDFDAIYKNKLMNEWIHSLRVYTAHSAHQSKHYTAFNYRYKITVYWIAWWYQLKIQLAVAVDWISRWNWNERVSMEPATSLWKLPITKNYFMFFTYKKRHSDLSSQIVWIRNCY